jgi:hypothetical protein
LYAVVVRETGQPEAIEGSAELRTANRLPRVRQAPGILSASFMSDGEGATLNVLVFETEENRKPLSRSPAMPHVQSSSSWRAPTSTWCSRTSNDLTS